MGWGAWDLGWVAGLGGGRLLLGWGGGLLRGGGGLVGCLVLLGGFGILGDFTGALWRCDLVGSPRGGVVGMG